MTMRATILSENPRDLKKPRPPDPTQNLPSSSTNPCSPETQTFVPKNYINVPSFKTKLLGRIEKRNNLPPREPVDLLASKAMSVSFKDDDTLRPEFFIDPSLKKSLMAPWENTLIIKALGKTVGYKVLYTRVHQMWKPKSELDILDLGLDFFLIRFENDEDMERALSDGPWMIQGHYLTARHWSPEFKPSEAKFEKTMAWVRFPEVLVMYYDDDVLRALASGVGKPIKVDLNTSLATRGQFTRVCVEIDLSKPLVRLLRFDEVDYKVVYEGLYSICSTYGIFGHASDACTLMQPNPPTANDGKPHQESMAAPNIPISAARRQDHNSETLAGNSGQMAKFGEWLMATWKPRRNQHLRDQEAGSSGKDQISNNGFHVLHDLETNNEHMGMGLNGEHNQNCEIGPFPQAV